MTPTLTLTYHETLAVLLGAVGEPIELTIGSRDEPRLAVILDASISRADSWGEPGADDEGLAIHLEPRDTMLFVNRIDFEGMEVRRLDGRWELTLLLGDLAATLSTWR